MGKLKSDRRPSGYPNSLIPTESRAPALSWVLCYEEKMREERKVSPAPGAHGWWRIQSRNERRDSHGGSEAKRGEVRKDFQRRRAHPRV